MDWWTRWRFPNMMAASQNSDLLCSGSREQIGSYISPKAAAARTVVPDHVSLPLPLLSLSKYGEVHVTASLRSGKRKLEYCIIQRWFVWPGISTNTFLPFAFVTVIATCFPSLQISWTVTSSPPCVCSTTSSPGTGTLSDQLLLPEGNHLEGGPPT